MLSYYYFNIARDYIAIHDMVYLLRQTMDDIVLNLIQWHHNFQNFYYILHYFSFIFFFTARDYIAIYDVADAYLLRQTMDDFVLNLVNDEQTIQLENLLVSGYDHVMDITGLRRNRVVSARDIAVLKEYKDIAEMFEDWEEYQVISGDDICF